MSVSNSQLRGSIGVVGIVFLVVAAASPLTTIAGSLPVMIALGNGAGAPLTYLIAALVLLVFSVGYAAMSSAVTDTGAFYAYVTKGLGRDLGVGAAGLAIFAYATVQAGVYGLAANTIRGLVLSYGGPDLPWWVWAFLLMAIVGVVGYRNIDVGAKVLGVLLILEIVAVVALSVAVFARGGAQGIDFTSFTPGSFFSGSPGIAMMFAIGSFVGFEATAIYSEEAKNPKRTVPIATYVAIIVIGALYAIGSWAVVLAFGSNDVGAAAAQDTANLTFTAAATYLAPWAADVIAIMLVTSLFATLLAFHSAISRYLFALARRGYAPTVLASVHDKHGSPHAGSLVQSASAVVLVGIFALAGADPVLQLFTWMAGIAIVAILALMVLTSLAIIVYFRRSHVDTRLWHTRIAPVLGSLGLIAITALVIENFDTLMGGSRTVASIFLAAAIVVFVGGVAAGRIVHVRRAKAVHVEAATSSSR
ncbi:MULTISPECIES: APC family permease [unclassified Mycolicibacterium]|uniref:APC family permease n=1 Tax=unclassified Mycolicibacterium TaxID=2636767 RepID=UPI00130AF870|nr:MULTISPECIES: APC family permease [unclassified Mycolicibacterium]MUL83542.1 APC family permease [Mycolicibacterium sp. CBMA 329]MUL90533.1 APC family permease [Mycolicibacterium sp. CBMA 331]MUM00505.1 APC family permease [Mycolicibacterium sp. CBMA 334]MUM25395.1 APC family permease [Mycolicibacterium sp. CBMA 295]MUM41477.1 APC family permease [Mycolicibacterium sp. CBMA 247]